MQASGINAEIMPGQWEYQIGPLGPLDSEISYGSLGNAYIEYLKNLVLACLHHQSCKGDWNGTESTNFYYKCMKN